MYDEQVESASHFLLCTSEESFTSLYQSIKDGGINVKKVFDEYSEWEWDGIM